MASAKKGHRQRRYSTEWSLWEYDNDRGCYATSKVDRHGERVFKYTDQCDPPEAPTIDPEEGTQDLLFQANQLNLPQVEPARDADGVATQEVHRLTTQISSKYLSNAGLLSLKWQVGDDGDDTDNNKRHSKRHNNTLLQKESLQLACPFHKYKPQKYNHGFLHFRSCSINSFNSIYRLKEHLRRAHSPPIYCPRCSLSFLDQDSFINHAKSEIPCQAKPELTIEAWTIEMDKKITKSKDETERGYWERIYRELFNVSSLSDIPSPYFVPYNVVISNDTDLVDFSNDPFPSWGDIGVTQRDQGRTSPFPIDSLEEDVDPFPSFGGSRETASMRRFTQNRVLDWLTPIDFDTQQSDFISRRTKGTGQWFLDSTEFQTWLNTDNKVLFCQGLPGAGKTVLTSIVVDYLLANFQGENVGIAYLYCDVHRQDELNIDGLLASLLKQLARGIHPLPESVDSLYNSHEGGQIRLTLNEISSTLRSIAALYSRCFIVIDALDECQTSNGCRTRLLREIFALLATSRVNIFSSSRSIPDIEYHFKNSMQLEIKASDHDIRIYIDGRMSELPTLVLRNSELQGEIKAAILKAASGLFLPARLYFDSLKGIMTPKAIRAALEKLSTGNNGYDYAYENAMRRIEGQIQGKGHLAKQALSWIIYAKRPLTTTELLHALAVELGESQFDEENLCQVEDILSMCAGLVVVEEGDIIRLLHNTTEEYFERTRARWFPNAETDIATTCVTYLSFDVFNGICQNDEELKDRFRIYPLYNYAAYNWGHHAYEAQPLGKVLIDFLMSKSKVDASVQAMCTNEEHSTGSDSMQRVLADMTGLHLGAYFGIGSAAQDLLMGGHEPDPKDSCGRTPLSYAAEYEQTTVVELLLNTGKVDAGSRDTSSRTPMLYAAINGSEAVFKLLLKTGKVDVDTRDSHGRTPLIYAAANGYEGIVKLLLDTHKVETHSKDNYNMTPLSYADQNGHSTIARLLQLPTLNDSSKQKNLEYEADDDSETSTCDQSDIESVFTSASVLSSQPSHGEQFSDAVFELAQLLLNDDELMLLYPKAISKVGGDRFQRNFARFLEGFSKNLLGEASNDLQRDAAHFVQMSARRTAAEVGKALRQDSVLTMALKPKLGVSKATQVNAWLEVQKRDHEQRHAEIQFEAEDGSEPSDESDSSGSDTFEQNPLRTLDEVKEFMLSAQAWLNLRQELRVWLKLDKRRDGNDDRHDDDEKLQDGKTENPKELANSCPPKNELQGGHRRTYILKIMDVIEQFRRPRPLLGYQRITWESAYGKPLYIDVKESIKGGAEQLQERLRKSASLTQKAEPHSAPTAGVPSLPPPVHVRRNPGTQGNPRDSSTRYTPGRQADPVATSSRSNLTTSNEQQLEKRYLLLCFSTSKSKSFRQIDVTDLSNDQYLFQRIHDFTLMPIRQDVCPYGIEQSLPPKEEVEKKNWDYYPCPRTIECFHVDEAVVTQLLEPGHAFLDSAWLELFPKKLKDEFRYKYQETGIGWGIHIVEGLNPLAVAWVGLFIFLSSGVLGLVYSIVAGDAGAGFTISAWLAMTVALSVTWLQLRVEKTTK
ncbi:hypothetical protein V492_04887 [Pseudogymnoascus sp. VKM F-4246]|nr:hypothetical protein V492_04887 [Pseudogymnoascus sp. VKM F-4246]